METSIYAVASYLWRLGRGQGWASGGSGSFATTAAQLVVGLAPILGWGPVPDVDDVAGRERFVRRHRASVQRWLDWLSATGLVEPNPDVLPDGRWHRTVIHLGTRPECWPAETLEAVIARERGWGRLERVRARRGRRRNLTAILRRSRLSKAERRERAIARRKRLRVLQQQEHVRELAARDGVLGHLRHPLEPWTTSRRKPPTESDTRDADRGHARKRNVQNSADCEICKREKSSQESENVEAGMVDARLKGLRALLGRQWAGLDLSTGEGTRWLVYRQVLAERSTLLAGRLAARLRAQSTRQERLLCWTVEEPPPLWWLAELFVAAAHGPDVAALPHGFRLAFLSPTRDRETFEHAAVAYRRAAASGALPAGFPQNPYAGFAHWLTTQTEKQDGPQRGVATDLHAFRAMCRSAAAYARWTRAEHAELCAKRAFRRLEIDRLAARVNQRFNFREPASPAARVKRARELLTTDYTPHQHAGRKLLRELEREARLVARDRALREGRHPGFNDGTYTAACRHAEKWGLCSPDRARQINQYHAALQLLRAAHPDLGLPEMPQPHERPRNEGG